MRARSPRRSTRLSGDGRTFTIHRRPSDGSGEPEALVTLPNRLYLGDLSRDGRRLIFDEVGATGGSSDILALELREGATPQPVIATTFDEYNPRFSPDGRWLAYVSTDTGLTEVFVRPADGRRGRWQVSSTGGDEPRWSADGRQLFYTSGTTLMPVTVEAGKSFNTSAPTPALTSVYNLRTESGNSSTSSGRPAASSCCGRQRRTYR